jgi:hypothetical protein
MSITASSRKFYFRAILGLLALAVLPPLLALEIKQYSASYSAKFNGMDIEADHRLEKLESGQYRETLKAKNIFGKINEQALFSLSENQLLIPQEYSYERSLMGVKRVEQQVFDWPNQQLEYRKKDQLTLLPLQPGALDIITHKLQLRSDLQSGKENFSYPVISRGKLKQYVYQVTAREVLETAIGPLNTVLVQRIREDKDRTTKIWLASDWDFLAVQLEQIENGESHQMKIINAQVYNQPVVPLNIAAEK